MDLVATQQKLKLNLHEIEYAVIGGSTSTPALMKEAKRIMKIKKFQSIYGLTEATSTVFHSLQDEDSQVVEEFVGCVGDHIETKVIDKGGKAVPFGQPGELCLRGYCTMLGYYNDDKKTKEVMDCDRW